MLTPIVHESVYELRKIAKEEGKKTISVKIERSASH